MAKQKTSKKKASPKKRVAKSEDGTPVVAAVADDNDLSVLRKIFDEASKAEEKGLGLRQADVECPHCGEEFEISVDPSEEDQEVVQNCQVCGKAITFSVEVVEGELSVNAYGN